MANPRKFSEKIALHNQKQAEETAAFNQILQEVSHVIARVNPPLPKQHLHVNQSLGTYRGGSLPNVNHIGSNSIDLKGALTNLEEINAEGAVGGISGDGGGAAGAGSSPSGGAPSPAASRREGGSGGGGSQGRTSNQVGQERGRSMGVGPMRGSRPGGGNRIDTSPYGSAAYLSPPPASDTSWRRTNSDSALHHSAMSGAGGSGQGGSNAGIDTLHLSQGSPRRAMDGQYLGGFSGSSGGVEGGGPTGPCDPGGGGRNLLLSSALSSQLCDGGGRPRSCCDVPRVPGINIYPTSSQQEPGTLQIPSGNNTGSLPDLTNFHFPSPLPTPLDVEDHNSSSPYSSTSPQGGTSPTTLSPTSGGLSSSPRQHQGARFSFGQASSSPPSPIPVPPGGLSPGHSPTPNHRQPQQPHNMGSNLSHSPNHLSVPSLVNSSFLHSCKGLTFDNSSNMQMDSFQQNRYMYQPQPSNQPQHQLHHRQQQSQCSPPLLSNSQSIPTHLSSLSSYRSPHLNRPSPQSSPGLTVPSSPLGGYRSTSPVGRASPHSAPQSPVSPASSLGTGNQSSAALSNVSSHQHRHSTSSPSPSSPSPSPSSSSSTSAITTNSSSASQEQQSNYYLVQNFEQFSMMDNPVSTSNDFIGSQSGNMHYSLTSPSMSMVGSPDDGGGGIDSVNLACLGLEMGLGLSCGNTIGRVSHQDATNNGGMGQVTDGGYYSHRQSPSSPSSIAMDPTRQSQQQQQQQHHHHPHQQPHHQNQQHLPFGVGIRQLPSILSQPPPQPLDPIGGGGGGGGGGLSESGHHTAPQTPNSPTSIPDIILTDFSSGAGDDISATKDLSRVLAAGGTPGIIEEEDLSPYLFDADALRQDLGTLDSDGLQMLTAPDMNSITDPATEDHFRHDRL
ncbi:CREB-regulated transcription coactivator 1 [Hetaerina americana]|uniref:CREB-regulated transcription coactivator 1 n=1 Tax=Hetaerina americana TaxID=62018 RepID=UPI003A7F1337